MIKKIFFLINFFVIFQAVDVLAQTPFNPPFGFFGSALAKNATPWVTITTPAANYSVIISNQASIAITGTCSIPGRDVVISSGIITPLGTALCDVGRSFSLNVDVTSVADGIQPLTATITNVLGAAGSASVNIDKDTTAPVINISTVGPLGGGISGSINFAVTEAHATTGNYTLEVSNDGGGTWSALGTVAGISGSLSSYAFSYTWNPVSSWNITNAQVRVTGVDANTYSTTSTSANFTVDSTAPSVSFISVNSGAGSTTTRSIVLDATGADTLTKISSFCFKYDTTVTPLSADACWIPVTSTPPTLVAALSLNLTNYPYLLPPIYGAHNFYVWMKNEAGLISTLTNSGNGTLGTDLTNIVYTPSVPPGIINVIASSTDTPSTPASSTDLTITSGSSVYIKWTASDDNVLPATPISIYYTLDDVTYTLVANTISDSINAGCTLAGAETGCYKWVNASPSNSYFKIRVLVTDSDGNTAQSSSGPLNVASQFRILAGNTDPGTDGSASSAIFANQSSTPAIADPKSLVVSSTGIVYYLDNRRGLLKVDPNTGNQTLVIRETGTRSGDGGAISSATLKDPVAVVIDYEDNLYIWDDSRIRKVDFGLSTISVLIGGGASTSTSPIAATSLAISSVFADTNEYRVLMVPLPNGDIVLRTDLQLSPISDTHRFRIYRKSTGLVETLFSISGNRDMNITGQDVSLCYIWYSGFSFDVVTSAITNILVEFGTLNNGSCSGATNIFYLSTADPVTGVIQSAPYPTIPPISGGFNQHSKVVLNNGLDGKIYALSRSNYRILTYNTSTKDWTILVGNGVRGSCADGTLATSCAIDPMDVFVTQNGTIYFKDRGKIRMVDPVSNKVYSLYGQDFNFGDGGNPLSARFNSTDNLKMWNSSGTDKFIVLDGSEIRLREFSESGVISTIAGDGSDGVPNTTSAASTQVIASNTATAGWLNFLVEPTNGNIWYNRGSALAYLNRATDRWVDFVGSGGTYYYNGDGLTGANIKWSGSYYPYVMDFDSSGNIMAGSYSTSVVPINGFIKKYDKTTSVQSHVVGNSVMSSNTLICGNGNTDLSCDLSLVHSIGANWDSYTNSLLIADLSLAAGSDTIKKVDVGASTVSTFKTLPHTFNSFTYYRDAGLTVENFYYCRVSTLYKYNNLTSTETVITLPVPGMSCSGRGIFYSPTRGSLIFGAKNNGLGAVVELFNP